MSSRFLFLLPLLLLAAACESTPEEPEVDCATLADKKAAAACKDQKKQELARRMTSGMRGSRP
jgi:hypothetical protein